MKMLVCCPLVYGSLPGLLHLLVDFEVFESWWHYGFGFLLFRLWGSIGKKVQGTNFGEVVSAERKFW